MRLAVKLFASAREAAGAPEITLDVPETASAKDVLSALAARGGRLGEVAARSRLAVNRTFAAPGTPVAPEDEVALIPPVGGG